MNTSAATVLYMYIIVHDSPSILSTIRPAQYSFNPLLQPVDEREQIHGLSPFLLIFNNVSCHEEDLL